MAALTGMEASAKSAGQGRPATFYSPLLQTLTINTVYKVLIQLQTQAFTQNVSKCKLLKIFSFYIFFNKNYVVLFGHIVY